MKVIIHCFPDGFRISVGSVCSFRTLCREFRQTWLSVSHRCVGFSDSVGLRSLQLRAARESHRSVPTLPLQQPFLHFDQ